MDTYYTDLAQKATVLNYANSELSHFPKVPKGLSESDSFYIDGSLGARTSNLAWGYNNLADSVVTGWMEDGDVSNRSSESNSNLLID